MEPIKFTLCPQCAECPRIEINISDQSVTIGEEANAVRLSLAALNALVRLIKSGQLDAAP